MKATKTGRLLDWQPYAEKRVLQILKCMRRFPSLRRLGTPNPWTVETALVGPAKMTQINQSYRGKSYPTDILSFPAPTFFRNQGHLGELIICWSTLKKQAKSQGHTVETEMDVLLTHGLLHLLGFDHEEDPKQSAVMARWEVKILQKVWVGKKGKSFSLILRANSGNRCV